MAGAPQESEHKPPSPEPPSLAGCWLTARFESRGASLHRDFVQADILDSRPDDRQATGLCREHINLIGALAHITEQTFNRIGRLNVSVHSLRKGIKGQEVLFILSQAADCLWIALSVFGFEGC